MFSQPTPLCLPWPQKQKPINCLGLGFLPPGRGHSRCLHSLRSQNTKCDSKGMHRSSGLLSKTSVLDTNFVTVSSLHPYPSNTHIHAHQNLLHLKHKAIYSTWGQNLDIIDFCNDTRILNIYNLTPGKRMIYLFHPWNKLEFYLCLRP